MSVMLPPVATETSATTETTAARLIERWPTAIGLVVAASGVAVIVGLDVDEAASDFGPGAAAMMVIYVAAFAIGKPMSAWLAFAGVIAVAALQNVAGIEGALGMTVVLGLIRTWSELCAAADIPIGAALIVVSITG